MCAVFISLYIRLRTDTNQYYIVTTATEFTNLSSGHPIMRHAMCVVMGRSWVCVNACSVSVVSHESRDDSCVVHARAEGSARLPSSAEVSGRMFMIGSLEAESRLTRMTLPSLVVSDSVRKLMT